MAKILVLFMVMVLFCSVASCSHERRSIGDEMQKLCEVESELSTLSGVIEALRTDCVCSKTPEVENSLRALNKEIDLLRDQCFCLSTSNDSSTNYTSNYTSPPVTTHSPQELYCPNGMTQYESHCYVYIGTTDSWGWARDMCIYLWGGYLSTVESEEENFFLIDLWNATTGNEPMDIGPWLGGNLDPFSGLWVWNNTGEAITEWFGKDPMEVVGKDCLRFVGDEMGGCTLEWSNYNCYIEAPYFCEKDLL